MQLGTWAWILPFLGKNLCSVSLSIHICRTSWHKSNHVFLLFPFRPQMFWGRDEEIFKNGQCRYLGSWKFKANIWIFQIAFSQWIAPLIKHRFLFFFLICMWERFQHCQSSYFCFFVAKTSLFLSTNWHILFLWLTICIFANVQTKKIVFGREMSKIQPFTFYIFFTL